MNVNHGQGGQGEVTMSPKQARSHLKAKLNSMIADTGPELFVMSANAENQAAMTAATTEATGSGDPTSNAPFNTVLDFMTAIMTKEYAEAIRLGEIVLQLEPGNATIREFIPVLQEILSLTPGQEDDAATDSSDDSGSGSDSDGTDSSGSDDADQHSNSDSKSDDSEGSGSENLSESGSASDSDLESLEDDQVQATFAGGVLGSESPTTTTSSSSRQSDGTIQYDLSDNFQTMRLSK